MIEMKTLTMGGKTYEIVDAVARATLEAGVGVSSWNELTDKPFYDKVAEVELVPEQELELIPNDTSVDLYQLELTPAPFALTEGETYRAVLDGSEYELICTTDESSRQVLSHTVTDENTTVTWFVIQYSAPEVSDVDGGAVTLAISSSEAKHTVALYHKTTSVKTLDAKFIPMDDIDTRIEEYVEAYIREALEGEF